MKKTLIISGIVFALIALGIFNKLTTRSKVTNVYAEVKEGQFEITVSTSGELLAENSLEVRGPELGQNNQDHGGGNQGRQSPQQRGGHMRVTELKIQDIVPEGTIVKAGDYIAQLEKTTYENTLKDELENLTTYRTNLDMKILDTAVTLTNLRDQIKNQRYVVEEAEITLAQSKFEPPATIRKAEMALDRAKRSLEQMKQDYTLKVAQNLSAINREKRSLNNGTSLVADLQAYLAEFTINAPTDGMVIYKKERNGTKRKTGSSLNPFDLVIATLPDLSSMISKIYINEIDISKIKNDQKVVVSVDAFPDKSFTGNIISIANVGEQLPNSDSKMFEVLVKINGSDPTLRPSMTTDNKVIIKTYDNVVYVPTESVHTGADSIPFVYEKNKTKQIVVLGESNEKNIIVEQGLKAGTTIFLVTPEDPESYKVAGEELIPVIRDRIKAEIAENQSYLN